MTETMDVLSSIPRALGPLGQVADLAGGFFGSRGLGVRRDRPASSSASRTSRGARRRRGRRRRGGQPPPARPRWSRTAPSAQDTFRRSAAKHPAPKEPAPAKRTTAKKATKRTTAKATAKKAPAKRATAKKAAPPRSAAPPREDRGEAGGAQEGRLPIEPVSRRSLSPTGGRRPGRHTRLAVHRVAGRVGEQALLAGAGRVHVGDGEAPLEQRRPARRAALAPGPRGGRHPRRGGGRRRPARRARRRPRRRRSSPGPRWCRGGRGAAGCRSTTSAVPSRTPSRSTASGRAPSARWYGTSPGNGQSYSSSGQLPDVERRPRALPHLSRRWPTGSRPASAVASRAGRTRRGRGGRRRPS